MDAIVDNLQKIADTLRANHGFVDRVAIASIDAQCLTVSTMITSESGNRSVPVLSVPLEHTGQLRSIVETNAPRLIDDIEIALSEAVSVHARSIRQACYRSSLTIPISNDERCLGLLFLNSRVPGVFRIEHVDLVAGDIRSIRHTLEMLHYFDETLSNTSHVITQVMHEKDIETSGHLIRIAELTRIIAAETAADFDLNENDVRFLAAVAPLHDIGKLTIPDAILLKPGKLDEAEMEVIKTHPLVGNRILDRIRPSLPRLSERQFRSLRNVVRHHHEKLDGTGYPDGLAGEAVPTEARIVAVADVFDALVSKRPYKKPFSVAESLGILRKGIGTAFDARCVGALERHAGFLESLRMTVADAPV